MGHEPESIRKHCLQHLWLLCVACTSRKARVDVPARLFEPGWASDDLLTVQLPRAHNQIEQTKISPTKSTLPGQSHTSYSASVGGLDRDRLKLDFGGLLSYQRDGDSNAR